VGSCNILLLNSTNKHCEKGREVRRGGWLAGWLEVATGPGVACDALCLGLIITDLTCDVDPAHWVNSVLHL
jgi:hypothetical protein